jgi:hypothetical protein
MSDAPVLDRPVTTRELIVLDHTGDTKIIWDSDKPAEVDHARDTFDRFKAKGYMAYKVDRKGEKGEVMRNFDPDAEKLILAPATVGG